MDIKFKKKKKKKGAILLLNFSFILYIRFLTKGNKVNCRVNWIPLTSNIRQPNMEFDLQKIKYFLFLIMSSKHENWFINLVIHGAMAVLLRLNIAAFGRSFGFQLLFCVAMTPTAAFVALNYRSRGNKIIVHNPINMKNCAYLFSTWITQ